MSERICFFGCAEAVNKAPGGAGTVFIVCGPDCKRTPPAERPPEGLDFESAGCTSHLERYTDAIKPWAQRLNAQFRQALAAARAEERRKVLEEVMAEWRKWADGAADASDLHGFFEWLDTQLREGR